MKILVIGDNSSELATWTEKHHGSCLLLEQSNYKDCWDKPGAWFTGLGDLDFDQIKSVAMISDHVEFVNDLPWSDKFARTMTLVLCNHLRHFRQVAGIDPHTTDLYLTKPVARINDESQVWTFGCSTTAGVGLDDPQSQCYGRLVADRLDMPWQNVAQSGSSVRWALSHMLQADIRPDDIVVWGSTSAERIRRARGYHDIENTQLANCDRLEVTYNDDYQIYFDHMDYINMGIRYLRSRGIKFVFIGLIVRKAPYWELLELEFSGHLEWCPLLDWHSIDIGNDNEHIGPLGHKNLANRIYDHIKLLGY
jgi:hypothetical protein